MPYRDPAEKPIWCDKRGYQIPLLSCPSCKNFPCASIKRHMETLKNSLFTSEETTGLIKRRTRMYIFKMSDGALAMAPANFSPDNLAEGDLANVVEIYCVAKTLVKQTRLVVKPRGEIENIRKKAGK